MLNFRYGPDGSVHVIDWYDKNQCHSTNPDVHHKTLGRIFKISHEKDRWVQVDLTKHVVGRARRAAAASQRLVRAARAAHPAGARSRSEGARPAQDDPADHPDVTRKLRALWALHVTGGLTRAGPAARCSGTTANTSAAGRSTCSSRASSRQTPRSRQLRERWRGRTRSALVRLYLASALQRVPAAKRWDVVAGLLRTPRMRPITTSR